MGIPDSRGGRVREARVLLVLAIDVAGSRFAAHRYAATRLVPPPGSRVVATSSGNLRARVEEADFWPDGYVVVRLEETRLEPEALDELEASGWEVTAELEDASWLGLDAA